MLRLLSHTAPTAERHRDRLALAGKLTHRLHPHSPLTRLTDLDAGYRTAKQSHGLARLRQHMQRILSLNTTIARRSTWSLPQTPSDGRSSMSRLGAC